MIEFIEPLKVYQDYDSEDYHYEYYLEEEKDAKDVITTTAPRTVPTTQPKEKLSIAVPAPRPVLKSAVAVPATVSNF